MNVAYSSPVMPAAAEVTDQRLENKNTIGICIVKAKLPDEVSKFKIEVSSVSRQPRFMWCRLQGCAEDGQEGQEPGGASQLVPWRFGLSPLSSSKLPLALQGTGACRMD